MLGDKFADPYDNLPVWRLKKKIPRKGSFKVSNFSKRHHLLDIMMALVTLHVLKSLPDTGGWVSPTNSTCSVFTPLLCSPQAAINTLLLPSSFPPFPSCILLITHKIQRSPSVELYRPSWEISPPDGLSRYLNLPWLVCRHRDTAPFFPVSAGRQGWALPGFILTRLWWALSPTSRHGESQRLCKSGVHGFQPAKSVGRYLLQVSNLGPWLCSNAEEY